MQYNDPKIRWWRHAVLCISDRNRMKNFKNNSQSQRDKRYNTCVSDQETLWLT